MNKWTSFLAFFLILSSKAFAENRCLDVEAYPCGHRDILEAMEKGRCTYNKDGSPGGYVGHSAQFPTTFSGLNDGYLHVTSSVCGGARVGKNVEIQENTVIKDYVWIRKNAVIGNNVVLAGRGIVDENAKVGNHSHLKDIYHIGKGAIYPKTQNLQDILLSLHLQSAVQKNIRIKKFQPSKFSAKFEKNVNKAMKQLLTNSEDQLIKQLKEINGKSKGVVFQDVILMEDISSFQDLVENLKQGDQSRKIDVVALKNDLAKTLAIHQEYLKNFPMDKLYEDMDLKKKLLDFQINWDALHVLVETVDYGKELKKIKLPKLDVYVDLYHKLLPHLNMATYEDPADECFNGNMENKKNDLVAMLANLKLQGFHMGRTPRLNDKITSSVQDPFPMGGKSMNWYEEINFKFFRIYQNIDKLTDEQKVLLLNQFIHGGRHCSDAKWGAINQGYQLSCATEEDNNPERTFKNGNKDKDKEDEKTQIYETLDKFKSDIFEHMINSQMENFKDKVEKEKISYYINTWDAYANHLGVQKRGGTYSHMHIPLKMAKFADPQIGYTLTNIYKLIKKKHSEELKRKTFGLLAPLVGDTDFITIGTLLRHNVLTPKITGDKN